jgi:hypothetical protein
MFECGTLPVGSGASGDGMIGLVDAEALVAEGSAVGFGVMSA